MRAKECRERAAQADYVMRQFLLEVARELEEEADKIDVEERHSQDFQLDVCSPEISD